MFEYKEDVVEQNMLQDANKTDINNNNEEKVNKYKKRNKKANVIYFPDTLDKSKLKPDNNEKNTKSVDDIV